MAATSPPYPTFCFMGFSCSASARPVSNNLTGICANTVCFASRFFRRAAIAPGLKQIRHRHRGGVSVIGRNAGFEFALSAPFVV